MGYSVVKCKGRKNKNLEIIQQLVGKVVEKKSRKKRSKVKVQLYTELFTPDSRLIGGQGKHPNRSLIQKHKETETLFSNDVAYLNTFN